MEAIVQCEADWFGHGSSSRLSLFVAETTCLAQLCQRHVVLRIRERAWLSLSADDGRVHAMRTQAQAAVFRRASSSRRPFGQKHLVTTWLELYVRYRINGGLKLATANVKHKARSASNVFLQVKVFRQTVLAIVRRAKDNGNVGTFSTLSRAARTTFTRRRARGQCTYNSSCPVYYPSTTGGHR